MDIDAHIKSIATLAKGGKKKGARNKLSDAPAPDDEDDLDELPEAVEDPDEDDEPGKDDDEDETEDEDDEQKRVKKRIDVAIVVKADEEQTVSGIVLQPEVVDAQGDIMSADVIKAAAYDFLASFNMTTKLGLQHAQFPKGKLALVESYVAPNGIVLGAKTVKQGSWIMTVKVLDADLWKKVKDGKIKGFSIGGKAKVVPLKG